MATTEIDVLRGGARISLAHMYLRDLENDADFGRMVDGRGSPIAASRSIWIGHIMRIMEEAKEAVPDKVAEVLRRLHLACPELITKDGSS